MSSAASRRDDARLAWLIVAGCAVVSLTVIVLLVLALRGPASRWADAQWRQMEAGAAAGRRARLAEAEAAYQVTTPVTPPRDDAVPIGKPARWVGQDDYPAYALRHEEQGRVRVTLAIDEAGVPTGCAIAESSGHWSLDNGTCLAMMRAGRFDHAHKGRRGVRHWTSPRVRWQL